MLSKLLGSRHQLAGRSATKSLHRATVASKADRMTMFCHAERRYSRKTAPLVWLHDRPLSHYFRNYQNVYITFCILRWPIFIFSSECPEDFFLNLGERISFYLFILVKFDYLFIIRHKMHTLIWLVLLGSCVSDSGGSYCSPWIVKKRDYSLPSATKCK